MSPSAAITVETGPPVLDRAYSSLQEEGAVFFSCVRRYGATLELTQRAAVD